jgi:hypothetical protein
MKWIEVGISNSPNKTKKISVFPFTEVFLLLVKKNNNSNYKRISGNI